MALLETVHGRNQSPAAFHLQPRFFFFYEIAPDTHACPNKAEGRPPREVFELQEKAMPLTPHLGFTFAISDEFHLFLGGIRRGDLGKRGIGIVSESASV